jgi:hypothetical protein
LGVVLCGAAAAGALHAAPLRPVSPSDKNPGDNSNNSGHPSNGMGESLMNVLDLRYTIVKQMDVLYVLVCSGMFHDMFHHDMFQYFLSKLDEYQGMSAQIAIRLPA